MVRLLCAWDERAFEIWLVVRWTEIHWELWCFYTKLFVCSSTAYNQNVIFSIVYAFVYFFCKPLQFHAASIVTHRLNTVLWTWEESQVSNSHYSASWARPAAKLPSNRGHLYARAWERTASRRRWVQGELLHPRNPTRRVHFHSEGQIEDRLLVNPDSAVLVEAFLIRNH